MLLFYYTYYMSFCYFKSVFVWSHRWWYKRTFFTDPCKLLKMFYHFWSEEKINDSCSSIIQQLTHKPWCFINFLRKIASHYALFFAYKIVKTFFPARSPNFNRIKLMRGIQLHAYANRNLLSKIRITLLIGFLK